MTTTLTAPRVHEHPADTAAAQTVSSEDVCQEVTRRWADYEPGATEEYLGIVPTELEQVRVAGRHALLAMDETRQPGNNYKYNGIAVALDRKLAERATQDDKPVRRIHIGSAGNAGAAAVEAARRRGLWVVVQTPKSLVQSKRELLESENSEVHAVHDSVEASTDAAKTRASADEHGLFMHAYDDLDTIAGQGLVAKRAIASLLQRQELGRVDLQRERVAFLIQRGGGSLITGFACALQEAKKDGVFGDNVELYEVRPSESSDRYDGLRVKAPGKYAQAILDDPCYVNGTVCINDFDTGRAAGDAGRHFHKRFEPSGLAGVAAFEHLRDSSEPATFVTVLSGSNTTSEGYAYFADAPRRSQAATVRSFVSRTRRELLDVPYGAPSSQQLNPCDYGRQPL